MVPVCVPEKVPAVADVKVIEACTVPEPVALTNRPVPPVMVKEPVRVKALGVEVGQIVSCTVWKTLSPFAPVYVSCSVAVNPPHAACPVIVLGNLRFVSPRWS